MKSDEIRAKFLEFFEKNGHIIVPSASLISDDPSVLFTTAGMQQFKSYFLGKESPFGKNVVSCQKCFRTSDIEEVGDERHLTFFEMLGNFSFGGYWKKEAIKYAYEFIVKEMKLEIDYATVFDPVKVPENDWRKTVPFDKESYDIWKNEIGLPESKIRREDVDNFWGPTGKKGPCGPTTEIYCNGIEIWNIVFNEYICGADKKLTPLEIKGVDTGMGLERLAMVLQKKKTVFETDLFEPIINEIFGVDEKAKRIIVDHIRGIVFLAAEGILPSNLDRGYVLRRLIRRVIRYGKLLKLSDNFFVGLVKKTIEICKDVYPEIAVKENGILAVIENEREKFEKALERGISLLNKAIKGKKLPTGEKELSEYLAMQSFRASSSTSLPMEMAKDILKDKGFLKDKKEEQYFDAWLQYEIQKHQKISRAGAEKKFGGHGAETVKTDEERIKITKFHTATHLLLAAMREILGPEIYQRGSDITAERMRFDFNYPQRLSEEEIKKIENLVNQKIKEDIAVEMVEMSKDEAIKIAKISFDQKKYREIVKVYKIGDFSIELCGGPHVSRTGELGKFRIIKEESSSAGVRRIKAVLE